MKSILTLIILSTLTTTVSAQGVGIGTNSPNASAILDVSSTAKGMLAPRMTSGQRTSIANPTKGLLVYDTDANNLYHYNGSAWSAVGNGGLTLPYAATPNLAGAAFKIDNLGAAIQASAANTSAAAITGVSTGTGGYGLLGQNHEVSGFGVGGFSSAGTGVYGFSTGAGTALRGLSTSGYGLFVSGNLRLTGGNTNPVAGAVLTSVDASGNAVWKERKIGFSVQDINPNLGSFPSSTDNIVHFNTKDYDYGNDFNLYTGSTPSFGHSTFVAPVSGLYHFDAAIALDGYIPNDIDVQYPSLQLFVQRGANIITPVIAEFSPLIRQSFDQQTVLGSFSRDVKLVAGDIITLRIRHLSGGAVRYWSGGDSQTQYFSGHLVFAE